MIEQNFTSILEESIKQNWEYPALSDYKGERFLYKEVAEKIERLHIIFEQCGIKQGDKIALIGKNSSNWGIVFLSVISYGGVIVPILPDFHPQDVQHIVNHSDSLLLFSSDNIYETLDKDQMKGLKAIFSLTDYSLIHENHRKDLPERINRIDKLLNEKYPEGLQQTDIQYNKIHNDQLAEISYTSGTTGFSKGVMLQHNSLAANVVFAHENMPLKSGDAIVSFLPLAHSYGCAFEFLFPFSLGCHIHFITRTPSPQTIIEAFKSVKPRLVLTVPLVMEKIYKKQILPKLSQGSVKLLSKVPLLNQAVYKKVKQKLMDSFGGNFHEVVIGGAPLSGEVEKFLKKIKFPFTIGYGMTECGPLISYSGWQETKLHSSGKVINFLTVTIDSQDPYKEVGEIMIKGENVMVGYYKNPEATRQAINEKGWLHTGDLGIIDKDNNIFIKGRSKSMILGPSGQNIHPEEIESKLNNLPYVQESLVIQKENVLVGLIYPDYELADQNNMNEKQIEEKMEEHRIYLNDQLPGFMKLSKIRLYPQEFEKTPKKSIKRFLYQEV